MKKWLNLTQIASANRLRGFHFFDPETIEEHPIIFYPRIYAGHLFVTRDHYESPTGEMHDPVYRVRAVEDDGSIRPTTDSEEFTSYESAVAFAREQESEQTQ